MMRRVGLALAGLLGLGVVGCGHAQVTGSAQNDFATPVGHAQATNPRYINPLAAAHPARDRSVFEREEFAAAREGGPPAPPPRGSAIVPEAAPPPEVMPPPYTPPAEEAPPPETAPLP